MDTTTFFNTVIPYDDWKADKIGRFLSKKIREWGLRLSYFPILYVAYMGLLLTEYV